MRSLWSRWNFPATALVLASVSIMMAGCGNHSSPGQTAPRAFEGESITLIIANHPWGEAMKPLLPEFEEATGLKVNVQGFFEDQLTQKLTVQFTSGSGTPEVFMYRPLQEGKLFYNNGWLEPLDDYVHRDADYDFADFSKQAVGSATVKGKLTGIPIITEQEVLYYRKDLLKQAGIAVPATIEELVEAARKLNDPANGVYGFVARGQRSPLVTQVSSFLYSEGGDFTQGERATLNTPEAIRAFTTYGTLLRNYGPPSSITMSWPQASAFFAAGKAALYTDASSIYKNVLDPAQSKLAEQIGYAPFPAGSRGSVPYNITSWGLAMHPKAANKEAAWAFIRWATSKEITLKIQQKGNTAARLSVWERPDGTTGFPAELVSVIRKSSQGGVDHDRPTVVSVAEARDTVGEIVHKIMAGEQRIQETADQANQQLQAILDKEAK
ncbi:sugar ABC transporter substrate-binding protein [Paenibacillus sp. H1-7]|uniref:ABC transporter substrate-binding protein n=1 Tax=Paenibacillus sp. H1-7 TaxID=2282849 RepID=UPI001EF98895|nr:sugar ABC transporter substrate-binding protein [Paenibacillus sp. H1-7]ULL15263.1 sugar ABC transporter substrate-binding protein [Paenibacillus sp. H1-7]